MILGIWISRACIVCIVFIFYLQGSRCFGFFWFFLFAIWISGCELAIPRPSAIPSPPCRDYVRSAVWVSIQLRYSPTLATHNYIIGFFFASVSTPSCVGFLLGFFFKGRGVWKWGRGVLSIYPVFFFFSSFFSFFVCKMREDLFLDISAYLHNYRFEISSM